MSATLYVARHGESEWNRAGRYQGRRESALTELGVRQAAGLADALATSGARRVFSSPLQRCRDTAAPVARALGVPVEIDARLVEIAHGSWEGRLREEIARDDAQTLALWRTQPDRVRFAEGESLDEVATRWRSFVESLDRRESLVVVTHDVIVRLAILLATNRRLGQLWEARAANCGYAILRAGPNGWHLAAEYCDAHLRGVASDPAGQAL